MARWHILSLFFLLILVSSMASCNLPAGGAPSQWMPTSALTISPPAESVPDFTATPLLLTPTPPTPTPSLTSAPPTAHPETITVQIFLIALEDNGVTGSMVGCNDSVVPVDVSVPYTTGVLRAALEQLLAIRTPYYGESGLYTPLYQSELTIGELTVEDGEATMRLYGNLMLGGMCDNPRAKAQLEEIALQFDTVQQVHIYINDIPLDDVLSLK